MSGAPLTRVVLEVNGAVSIGKGQRTLKVSVSSQVNREVDRYTQIDHIPEGQVVVDTTRTLKVTVNEASLTVTLSVRVVSTTT